MLNKIKNRVERELVIYLRSLNKTYSFDALSPALFRHIKGSLLQKGKRIRPSFFVIGYLGFSKKEASGLYTSALSMEFLHNFVLIHDDIIDSSSIRRGAPSAHKMLSEYIAKYKDLKATGEGLAMILGDVMYALGISAFLTLAEDAGRKERALKKLIDAAVYTGAGEFLELMSGTENIDSITKEDIYKIYDLKTGIYSFSTPLVVGAMLAGAKEEELNKLFRCGIYLGRAFQIKNDLSDSSLEDLRESKRTILVWYAYNNSDKKSKLALKKILAKKDPARSELLKVRKLMIESGAIDCVKKEMAAFVIKAKSVHADSGMRKAYKDIISDYSDSLIPDSAV